LDWTGKLRLTRVGSTTKAYYWNASAARWEWNGNTAGLTITGLGTGAVYVTVGSGNSESSFGFSVLELFDNFVAIGPNTMLDPPTGASATPAILCSPRATSQLSATPGAGGDTVQWFTDNCGQTPVPGGASPTVSPTATTAYYARTVNSTTGCVSSTCATVTVTVNPRVGADFNYDCVVDHDDYLAFEACGSGPAIPLTAGCEAKDLDNDNDVDASDFGLFQRCYSGANKPADPSCAD
jgi:hypothetical protein